MINCEKHKNFYAAANTGHGFISFFDEIFFSDKIKRRYIIKGGPGTGKSSFMKRVGLAASERGCEVEYYYCSSDTSSLDGVVIDGQIAIFDGTAPHSYDTVLPGARDEIINLGEFWKTEKLTEYSDDIVRLNVGKRESYSLAYGYLKAARSLSDTMDALISPCVLTNKMRTAAERIYSRLGLSEGTGNIRRKQTLAFGVLGKVRLDTLEKEASKRYYLAEYYGLGSRFLSELLRIAKGKGVECHISCDTVNEGKVTELYFPQTGDWFGIGGSDDEGTQSINMKRFADQEKIAERRYAYRTAARSYDEICALAMDALSKAGKAHGEIERFYVSSMDFSAQSDFCTEFIEKNIVKGN